ncbi:MAG: GGDEF domain-containing response regulator [Pseudomonadales bacterium]|nr:GGDEF domain-containing response regulator [Pseudomonadales bacterium]
MPITEQFSSLHHNGTRLALNVLLVQENTEQRTTLVQALGQYHPEAEVVEVASLFAAKTEMAAHFFDAVMVDEACAFDLLELIKLLPHYQPAAIILTKQHQTQHIQQYLQAGAQACLALPHTNNPACVSSILIQALLHRQHTSQLQQQIASLKIQAEHDALTGLYNRWVFDQALAYHLTQAARYKRSFALLLIDLDHFKQINDMWGHCAGDSLLQHVAERLKSLIRDSDTACRIGGDEFVILVPEILNARQPAILAERLAETLLDPIPIEGTEVLITASIGVAIYPDDGTNADALLRNADKAMYRGKHRYLDHTNSVTTNNTNHSSGTNQQSSLSGLSR